MDCLPTLVLTAQAVFLSERGQTDRHATERPTPAGGYTAGVGNKIVADF